MNRAADETDGHEQGRELDGDDGECQEDLTGVLCGV
jgi:hypothetical protein